MRGQPPETTYAILKASEGGLGQAQAMRLLREASIVCKGATSPFIGYTAVTVIGNQRVQARANKILFG